MKFVEGIEDVFDVRSRLSCSAPLGARSEKEVGAKIYY